MNCILDNRSSSVTIIFITINAHYRVMRRSNQELELEYQHQKWLGVIEPDPSDMPMIVDDLFYDENDAILESFDC